MLWLFIVHEQCFKDKHLDSVYYDNSNKKILGKMKDEFNGVKVKEFVGWKNKMYSLLACNDL